jgi:UPF0755 protein
VWKLIAAVLALLVVGAMAAAVLITTWLDEPTGSASVVVDVPAGDSLGGVALRLQRAGVLDHPEWFKLYARLTGAAQRIHTGEYQFTAAHTPRSVLADLIAGRVLEHSLAIIEGWSLQQALAAMSARTDLVDDLGAGARSTVLDALVASYGSAEGWLFPDTYRFRKGDSVSLIVAVAHERMRTILDDAWHHRAEDLPYESPYEALIMASIVEKETGVDEDRPLIARVFVSRLQLGMRLQSDPTVIYGLGESFDGDLTRAHLRAESPYNSYRRTGLPPTPIALPGLASINAALHPADGDYLYFVAKGNGRSEFSSSLDAHDAAVRRYQLKGEANQK